MWLNYELLLHIVIGKSTKSVDVCCICLLRGSMWPLLGATVSYYYVSVWLNVPLENQSHSFWNRDLIVTQDKKSNYNFIYSIWQGGLASFLASSGDNFVNLIYITFYCIFPIVSMVCILILIIYFLIDVILIFQRSQVIFFGSVKHYEGCCTNQHALPCRR